MLYCGIKYLLFLILFPGPPSVLTMNWCPYFPLCFFRTFLRQRRYFLVNYLSIFSCFLSDFETWRKHSTVFTWLALVHYGKSTLYVRKNRYFNLFIWIMSTYYSVQLCLCQCTITKLYPQTNDVVRTMW